MEQIIVQSVIKAGLPAENSALIKRNTIMNRVNRNNLKGMSGSFSQSSPMAEIEPILAESPIVDDDVDENFDGDVLSVSDMIVGMSPTHVQAVDLEEI
jgi:hypothetical protein